MVFQVTTIKTKKMNRVFEVCVEIMVVGSHLLGISYQQLNVWLFVIIHPAITIILIFKLRKYRKLWKKSHVNQ